MSVYVVMSHEEHRAYRIDGDGDSDIIGVFKTLDSAQAAAKKEFENRATGIQDYYGCHEGDYVFTPDEIDNGDEIILYAEDNTEAFKIEIVIKKFDI